MRNKFRLPLVAVFTTCSFQNHGSLHLVKAAASKNHVEIQTVDLNTALCIHGSWSFTPNFCPVQKIKTKFLVCPYFSVRRYCLIRPPFLFTFRVALAVWNAIHSDEAVFLLQVECCITYRMLILRPYQFAQLCFTDLVLKWQILMDTVGENNNNKKRSGSPAELIWNESLFPSWGRMTPATVSATLKRKQKWRSSNSNNFQHLPRKLPRSPYSKRSSPSCVVNTSDTTSYTSVTGNISVHHVQRQTCVVTCGKNLFNKFNSFQTVTVR